MTLARATNQNLGAAERLADRSVAEVVHGFDRLHALTDEITELAIHCRTPATGRPAWVMATLGHEPDREPWGVLVRNGAGSLEACALLVSVPGPGPDLIRLAGSGWGHRGALLAATPDAAGRLGRAMAAALSARTTAYRLSLGPLDVGCEAAQALVEALPGTVCAPVDPVPVVRLGAGRHSGDYLTGAVQRTLRKAGNRMARDGRALDVRFTSDRARIVAALPDLEATHRDRDHARGRDSDLDDPTARLLWHARMRALADEGSLELAVARLDGHLAAFVLGIADRPTYRVLEGHLVTEWARYAPGRVLESAVLQRVLDDRGYDTLDWMTSVASETLLATNDHERVAVVRRG